jgi:hypothetical protein
LSVMISSREADLISLSKLLLSMPWKGPVGLICVLHDTVPINSIANS